jgi:putative transposase
MPATTRSADDRPQRTPPLACEIPPRVSRAQERTLLARLEAARQVYNACLGNACLGEVRMRARRVRESKAFPRARTHAKGDPVLQRLLRMARA